MEKWIKNTTGTDNTYAGQLITAGSYHLITPQQNFNMSKFVPLINDIISGDALMARDNSGTDDISDANLAIDFLKGDIPPAVKMLLEDKNNPGSFNVPTHDSSRFFNSHIRKDFGTAKGTGDVSTITTTNIWKPAANKHVDITDIIIFGWCNETGKKVKGVVQIYVSGAWRDLIGVAGSGSMSLLATHAFQGHLDSDNGDGSEWRVRFVTSGNMTAGNFELNANVIAHEE